MDICALIRLRLAGVTMQCQIDIIQSIKHGSDHGCHRSVSGLIISLLEYIDTRYDTQYHLLQWLQ